MLADGSRKFQLGFVLATAFSLSLWSVPGQAYTPEQEQACTSDAFRLCSSAIPDVDRVTTCMVRNKSQLSPGCRAFFRPDPGEVAVAPAGKPMVIKPAAKKNTKAREAKKLAKPAT